VLFETGVLDGVRKPGLFENWPVRKYYGADTLWHDYLVFKCRSERSPSASCIAEIQTLASALLPHVQLQRLDDQDDRDIILDGLCWLGMEACISRGLQEGSNRYSIPKRELADLEVDLLSAATYFGCLSLVGDLLDRGCIPAQQNGLLPSPMYVAAWSGRAEMLQIMQEHLPDLEDSPQSSIRSHRKVGPGSLEGAAVRGDMDMVRLALYPPSRKIVTPPGDDNEAKERNSLLIGRYEPGSVPIFSDLYRYIEDAMRKTASPEVYQYLRSFVDPASYKISLGRRRLEREFATKVAAGDLVMVRHLLGIGVDPVGEKMQRPPLVAAVQAGHDDVVDLLLQYDADLNKHTDHHGLLLTAAAHLGSMTMMQKLLDAGAKLGERWDADPLWHALRKEHSAMVELLLRMGAGSARSRSSCFAMALDTGLESMVSILELWGVEEDYSRVTFTPPG
jgi:ankyrin repeat protein